MLLPLGCSKNQSLLHTLCVSDAVFYYFMWLGCSISYQLLQSWPTQTKIQLPNITAFHMLQRHPLTVLHSAIHMRCMDGQPYTKVKGKMTFWNRWSYPEKSSKKGKHRLSFNKGWDRSLGWRTGVKPVEECCWRVKLRWGSELGKQKKGKHVLNGTHGVWRALGEEGANHPEICEK